MTAKEKAKELVEKMWHLDEGCEINDGFELGKKSALIIVDEIYNTIYNEDFDGHLIDEIGANIFWKEVRKEIEKM